MGNAVNILIIYNSVSVSYSLEEHGCCHISPPERYRQHVESAEVSISFASLNCCMYAYMYTECVCTHAFSDLG